MFISVKNVTRYLMVKNLDIYSFFSAHHEAPLLPTFNAVTSVHEREKIWQKNTTSFLQNNFSWPWNPGKHSDWMWILCRLFTLSGCSWPYLLYPSQLTVGSINSKVSWFKNTVYTGFLPLINSSLHWQNERLKESDQRVISAIGYKFPMEHKIFIITFYCPTATFLLWVFSLKDSRVTFQPVIHCHVSLLLIILSKWPTFLQKKKNILFLKGIINDVSWEMSLLVLLQSTGCDLRM